MGMHGKNYLSAICPTFVIWAFIGSCAPLEKANNRRDPAISDTTPTGEAFPSCVQNLPPTIHEARLNRQVFCEEGLAHIIVNASDPDTDKLEYRAEMNGALWETDPESRSAFYSEILEPRSSYSVQLAAGDGCEISLVNVNLDGTKYCSEKFLVNSDDAYIRLPISGGATRLKNRRIHDELIARAVR